MSNILLKRLLGVLLSKSMTLNFYFILNFNCSKVTQRLLKFYRNDSLNIARTIDPTTVVLKFEKRHSNYRKFWQNWTLNYQETWL